MKRTICLIVGLAMLVVPAWATACWPGWAQPVYQPPVCVPRPPCAPPVYPQAYSFTPVFVPATGYAVLPPVIEPQPRPMPYQPAAASAVAPAEAPRTAPPVGPGADRPKLAGDGPSTTPAAPLRVEPVRPTSATENSLLQPAPIKKPEPAPSAISSAPLPPKQVSPALSGPDLIPPTKVQGATRSEAAPEPQSKPLVPAKPSPDLPNPGPGDGSQFTKPIVPTKPVTAPTDPLSFIPGPPLVLPGAPAPAAPSPAPAPADPLMPTPNPGEGLPPLSLPPEVAPKGAPGSVSRSSPLTGEPKSPVRIERFPVAHAEGVPNGYCLITYYNHTSQDVNLTIEGRSVKLPAKMYVEAKVARAFNWSQGERPASREQVGEGYLGIDIVFRE